MRINIIETWHVASLRDFSVHKSNMIAIIGIYVFELINDYSLSSNHNLKLIFTKNNIY